MNPEDNNPLTNPGAPAPGMDPTSNSASSFGASNGYVAPEMGASFAVQGGATTPDLNSIGEVVNNGFESTDTTLEPTPADTSVPTDEPLVPAAPVPGSIGSAISAPPATAAPAEPVAAPAFSASAPTMGSGPMPAPAVAPQVTGNTATNPAAAAQPTPAVSGFTPFSSAASTTNPATSQASAPTAIPTAKTTAPASPAAPGINPAFQPAAKPKKPAFSFKLGSKRTSIILLIAAAIFMVATVVMAVLYFQAANKPPKIVYTQNPEQNQTANREVLQCSGQDNFGYLVGSEAPITGTRNLTAGYINGALSGLTVSFSIPFPDEGLAVAGKDALALEQATLLSNIGESFISNYWVYGNTAEAIISTKAGFENKDAIMFLYGLTDSETSTDLETLQEKYESEGLTCEVK